MANYYDINAVKVYGKRLHSKPRHTDGRLVAVCDRAIFEFAVDVTSQDEYDHFYDQYSQGFLLSMVLYDYTPPHEIQSDNG